MPAKNKQVVAACLRELWAIERGKLEQIRAFLELRARGKKVTREDIQQSMSARRDEILGFAPDEQDSSRDRDRRYISGGVEVLRLHDTLAPRLNLLMEYSGGTSTQRFAAAFERAVADTSVESILLDVDSPGGVFSYCAECADIVYQARGVKRVVAAARNFVTSAAYWIASGASEFVASPSTQVGAIGVFWIHRDATVAGEMEGLRYRIFRSDVLKGIGSETETLQPSHIEAIQHRIDAAGQMFVDAVARNRGTSIENVRDNYGQGDYFLAAEAESRGMIDRVQTIEAAFEALQGSSSGVSASASSLRPAVAAIDRVAADYVAGDLAAAVEGAQIEGAVALDGHNLSAASMIVGMAGANEPTHAAAAAAVQATDGGSVSNSPTSNVENRKMDKIRAALFALGFTAKIDATDETCEAVLAGIYGGAEHVPKGDDRESLIIEKLRQPGLSSSASAATARLDARVETTTPEVATQAGVEGERTRQNDLRARAATLVATGLKVSDEQIQAAIDGGKSVAEIVDGWVTEGGSTDPAITRVDVTGSEHDIFATAAVDVLCARFIPETNLAGEAVDANLRGDGSLDAVARGIRRMTFADIVRKDLQLRGDSRVDRFATKEDMCEHWLAQGGRYQIYAADGAGQTAGDFPNLMSSLVGRMLDQAIQLSDATYRFWTGRLPEIDDLKPRLIVAVGGLDRLDRADGDDAGTPPLTLTEETPGWIQLDRFQNKVGLTPVMAANDDLDAFSQGINGLGQAHERTINHLCLELIATNVVLLDGNGLYDDTNHGNDVTTGGGAPSQAQATLMKARHRRQTGIAGVGKVRTPPKIALVPTEHEEAADQVFLPFTVEAKLAATDANLNTHRGKIIPVVEPDLEDYSSGTDRWFTFAEPAIRRTIVHAFQQGYGAGGRRTSWFDNETGTRYTKLEGRMAAAAAGYRGAVRNSGTA